MGFTEKFVRQCRKPQGLLGRFVGRAMNAGHAKVRRWGLGYVSSESYVAVLDVGCGGGGALREMASTFPNAKLQELFNKLIMAGAGQWTCGHWVPASALAYPESLRYLLSRREENIQETAFNLIMYFEQGSPLQT